ncbi:dienelactone hydrolase family protein [Pedomonas mirosovicensis]|uniref:dienelactone hydrolase family protein n=1 Tax=Pedomonas mirosovicensis TaxID=2908641 RepID=UPI002166C419|nr:dienelactone hydrolase family protein [Pedomonas mirosovicensis]MCH8684230.1 dienelactone hydrolase family protein [Pedomonas mirosovicensis]
MTRQLPEDADWISTAQWSRRQALGAAAAAGFAVAAGPVAASAIRTDSEGLDAGWVQVPVHDRSIPAYRAKPAGGGPRPVILVVQEIFGVHAWIQDIVRRFAKAGYYAIAPDLYARQGDATKVADIPTLVRTIVSKVPDAQVMGDLDATVAFTGKDGGNADLLGITGFCWGGRIVWLYTAHNPGVKAGVAWYGRLRGEPNSMQPTYPIDVVDRLKAPVLGLYGGQDRGIPLEHVEAMRVALAQARSPSQIIVYSEAEHGFLADYRPSYNREAATAAWKETLGWFGRHLR